MKEFIIILSIIVIALIIYTIIYNYNRIKKQLEEYGFCEGEVYRLKERNSSWCAYEYIIIDDIQHGVVYYRTKSDPDPVILLYVKNYTSSIDFFKTELKEYKLYN